MTLTFYAPDGSVNLLLVENSNEDGYRGADLDDLYEALICLPDGTLRDFLERFPAVQAIVDNLRWWSTP